MKDSRISDCGIVMLETHSGKREGNLTVVQNNGEFPFEIKRTYYLYDVPGGESRGGHSHKALHELIVAASGSFTVTVDDGPRNTLTCSTALTADFISCREYGARLTTFPPVQCVLFLPPTNT